MDCSLKLSRWCSAAPLLQRLEQRRIWQDTPEPALPRARLRYNPRSSIPHNQVSEAEMEFGFGFGTIAIIIVVLYVLSSIKILAEYERGVIFRLGRLLEQAKGPGVILVFTPFDRMVRVSLRQEAIERRKNQDHSWPLCLLQQAAQAEDHAAFVFGENFDRA